MVQFGHHYPRLRSGKSLDKGNIEAALSSQRSTWCLSWAHTQLHPGCSRFSSLRLNRKGTLLLASSLDKHARMFEVGTRAAGDEGFTAHRAQQKIQSLPKASRGSHCPL